MTELLVLNDGKKQEMQAVVLSLWLGVGVYLK